jgi:hypothetical protein
MALLTAIVLMLGNCGVLLGSCELDDAHSPDGKQECCCHDRCGSCPDEPGEQPHKHQCAPNCQVCVAASMPDGSAMIALEAGQESSKISFDSSSSLPIAPTYAIFHPPRV